MPMVVHIHDENPEEDGSLIKCTDRGGLVLGEDDEELFAFHTSPGEGLWLYIYCSDVHIVHLGDSGDEHETLGLAVFAA